MLNYTAMSDNQLPLFTPPPPPAPGEVPPLSADGADRDAKREDPPRVEPGALTPSISLNAALGAWQEHMRAEAFSEHTVKAFSSDLRLLAKYAGPGTAIGDFTTQGLNDFLKWMQTARGVAVSPKTYARRITSIKSFFRWLKASNGLAYDPAAPVIQHSVQSPLPDYLYDDEVERARLAAEQIRLGVGDKKPEPRPYLLFHLLLQTGIKKGECAALIPNHIDLSDPGGPVVFIRYANPRQRYKERKLKLDSSWAAAFREYLEQYQPETRLFPWSERRLEYMLEDIGELAGLEKRVSFDCLRWTCAVRDRKAGMEPDKIRLKLGLSKIQWREIGVKLEKLVSEAL
ncbi:MAG: site-specific integrase [Chloroflexi bacterium]|nr:site-specific integrase [Chloroflexota bacterium]